MECIFNAAHNGSIFSNFNLFLPHLSTATRPLSLTNIFSFLELSPLQPKLIKAINAVRKDLLQTLKTFYLPTNVQNIIKRTATPDGFAALSTKVSKPLLEGNLKSQKKITIVI